MFSILTHRLHSVVKILTHSYNATQGHCEVTEMFICDRTDFEELQWCSLPFPLTFLPYSVITA